MVEFKTIKEKAPPPRSLIGVLIKEKFWYVWWSIFDGTVCRADLYPTESGKYGRNPN
jgi:hypothetical protein